MQGIRQDLGSSRHGELHLILLVSASAPREGPSAADVADHQAAVQPGPEPDVGGDAQSTGAKSVVSSLSFWVFGRRRMTDLEGNKAFNG